MSGPILIFDSGVGGLSVVAAIRTRLPEVALCYACDNAMLPYGTKPDEWLVQRILDVCQAAVAVSHASALVVACNTASTLALEALRNHLEIPVIGTVPAIKPAVAASRSGHLALLATSATVHRPYTRRLIDDFAGDCRVMRLAADPLVEQAERQLAGEPLDPDVISACLAPLWEETALDTVVLGCTHFPLLIPALAAAAPRPITWVDSGDAIARRVVQVVAPLPCSTRPGGGNPGVEAHGASWATAPGGTLAPVLSRYGFAAPGRLMVATTAFES
ncbi:glutamate racemase [Halomonas salinarum]|uniref:glutamate racemase n=1 Tax=Halomonas salinarum TaxID=1158993 RepID=UPI00143A153C|nr:glutamate racemase [Halomonas salinarum]